jgi:hypothetical protein
VEPDDRVYLEGPDVEVLADDLTVHLALRRHVDDDVAEELGRAAQASLRREPAPCAIVVLERTEGSIVNRNTGGGVNFRGRNLQLTAIQGGVGEAANRILTAGSGMTDVTAYADIWLSEQGGDLVSELIRSEHGSVDLEVPEGGIDIERLAAAEDLKLSAVGPVSLTAVEAARLRFELPTADVTLDIREARVRESLYARVDNLTVGNLIHTGAAPLTVDLSGGSQLMADSVDILAESGVGIDFTRLISDFAHIHAQVDNLRFLNMVVGSRAELHNSSQDVIADNLERRLYDYDLQLLPFQDRFYLYMGADHEVQTNTRVVNYDDDFIINDFGTENSLVRLTTKLPEIVMAPLNLFFGARNTGTQEETSLTDGGVNVEL